MGTLTIRPPRIVLCGVGRYGQEFARPAANSGWPMVAALNRIGLKVGRDLGEGAGLPVSGVDLDVYATQRQGIADTVLSVAAPHEQAHRRWQ